MFNTDANVKLNWFEKCYGEIKNDLKTVLNSEVDVRTRGVAAIKLGSLTVFGIASFYSIGVVSSLLVGATKATALKTVLCAVIIIGAREVYIMSKNIYGRSFRHPFFQTTPTNKQVNLVYAEHVIPNTLLEPVYKDVIAFLTKKDILFSKH